LKILNLQMIAYGPFTSWSVNLSKGSEGLHLIYGLNETGKSAALRGLKALLFGIDERSTDAFVHDYSKLRVAGCIRRSDGTRIDIVRRKGRSKTLLAPDDTVLDERILDAFLGGVASDVFSHMFGLDHLELSRGGRDIVSGKGDVGESLFAAAVGGQGIHPILEPLEAEAAKLFSLGKPLKMVKSWMDEYQQAIKEAKEASLPSREWEEQTRQLSEADDRKTRLSEELGRCQAEVNRLERLKNALPYLSKRKELQQRRADMGEVLMLPLGFSEKRRAHEEALGRATEKREKAGNKLADLAARHQAIRVPTALITEAGVITKLHQSMGSYVKGMQDLPKRIGEAEQLEDEAAIILDDVQPGAAAEYAETLRLGLAKRQAIRQLGGQYEVLFQMLKKSGKLLDTLRSKLEKARADLGKAEAHRETNPLKDLLRRVQRSGDLEAAHAKSSADLVKEIEQAEIELHRLLLWKGNLEELALVPVPAIETVSRFEAALSESEHNLKSRNSTLAQLQAEESDLSLRMKSLELTRAVPAESDLAQARKRRQAGWALVRDAWLEGRQEDQEIQAFAGTDSLDKAYETSVHAADEVADRLRLEADRVAQHANWTAQRDRIREQIEKTSEEINRLSADADGLKTEWQELWLAIGIHPLSPKEMQTWIQGQHLLVQRADRIRACRNDIHGTETRIQETQREMRSVIERLGEPQPPSDLTLSLLIDHCQGLLERMVEANAARQKLESGIRDLENQLADAERENHEAEVNLQDWKGKWTEAVKVLPLADTDSPATANVLLDKIQDLMDKRDKAGGLRKRIEAIQHDAMTFTREIKEFAARFAPELQSAPPDFAITELNARLAQARADQATAQQLREQQRDQQKSLSDAEAEIRAATEKLDAICSLANCRNPEELDEIESRSTHARQIEDELNAVSNQLLGFAAGGTVEELAVEAEKLDPDALPWEIAERRDEEQRLKGKLSTEEQAIGGLRAALARMDGSSRAAVAAENAQSSLAQIRVSLERYVNLRLASIILRGEIEKYRAVHQGPVLKRASDVFAALTVGSFVGLRTDFDENERPLLVGVRASGEKVKVEGMSDGTCDQLYLSLRLASLEKHLEAHEPMPFIIDDILVNFDDRRAEATLKILSELSKKTQVIFFTHHQHLITLAERCVPGAVLNVHAM
jgi:uncharacterized protein YhaN